MIRNGASNEYGMLRNGASAEKSGNGRGAAVAVAATAMLGRGTIGTLPLPPKKGTDTEHASVAGTARGSD